MATPAVLTLRKAQEEDRGRLANLLHFEAHVHRHLDWRHALDWLGRDPFLVAENAGRLGAALACPPDPPSIAWLRLFAVSARTSPSEAWKVLWPAAEKQLAENVKQVVAIPLYGWFNELLSASKFKHAHNVVVLEWEPDFERNLLNQEEEAADVRAMRNEDIPGVLAVDNGGFPPLWQHSLETIQMAFAHCSNATVIEVEGEVAAYQISTVSGQGLHLARLAVHPKWQGKHFAQSLVHKLQREVGTLQNQRLTVNTQDINKPSLALYEKAGFEITKESFPVYQLEMSR